MEKNSLYKQIEKLNSQADEDKELLLILGYDLEEENLSMACTGDTKQLAAMVASALEDDPNENRVTYALLYGCATANIASKGKIMRMLKKIEKSADNTEKQP